MNWIYNLEFREPYFDEEHNKFEVAWIIEDCDALYDKANKLRQDKGYTDIPEDDNEIFYDFELNYSMQPNGVDKNVGITFTAKNTDKDDYAIYDLPVTNYEELKLLEIAERLLKLSLIEDGRKQVKALDTAINSLKKGEK